MVSITIAVHGVYMHTIESFHPLAEKACHFSVRCHEISDLCEADHSFVVDEKTISPWNDDAKSHIAVYNHVLLIIDSDTYSHCGLIIASYSTTSKR